LNRRKILFLLVAGTFCIVFANCSRLDYSPIDLRLVGLEYDHPIGREKIIELIRNVPQEVGIIAPVDLWFSMSFLELTNHSSELLALALDLFGSGELTPIEMFVVIHAVQDIDFDIYRHFLRNLAISFRRGEIASEYAEDLVISSFAASMTRVEELFENYNDEILREALKILLRYRQLDSYFRESIEILLGGGI